MDKNEEKTMKNGRKWTKNGQKWTKMDKNGHIFSNIVLFAWKCVETDFKLNNFEKNFQFFLV